MQMRTQISKNKKIRMLMQVQVFDGNTLADVDADFIYIHTYTMAIPLIGGSRHPKQNNGNNVPPNKDQGPGRA